ncbi:hypothetical protein NO348_02430 [Hungatella hathewayi]|uniref:substrate-binding periplasmic protein n=1 Tax=Hungatella hathewayi TaxID=154046 RepID=UPI00210DFA11|nr:transporter substrate-binding domain-containing protein [Hungatella hathewayi]MCQ5383668.1 hypothetical protein [Hungatella hathewayi]
MKLKWRMITALALLVLSMCGCMRQETESQVIRLAVESGGENLSGLTEELSKAWNRPVEIVSVAEDRLFDEISQGNCDAGIGLPEREERIKIGIWSLAVGEPANAVVIGNQPYRYSKELEGKKIGYPAGFPESQLVLSGGLQLNSYQNRNSMEQDLVNGVLDGIMLEGSDGETFMEEHSGSGYLISQLKDQPVLSRYLYSSSMDLIRLAAGRKKGE